MKWKNPEYPKTHSHHMQAYNLHPLSLPHTPPPHTRTHAHAHNTQTWHHQQSTTENNEEIECVVVWSLKSTHPASALLYTQTKPPHPPSHTHTRFSLHIQVSQVERILVLSTSGEKKKKKREREETEKKNISCVDDEEHKYKKKHTCHKKQAYEQEDMSFSWLKSSTGHSQQDSVEVIWQGEQCRSVGRTSISLKLGL